MVEKLKTKYMYSFVPFWWLDHPFGQITFSMVFLMGSLIIVNLFLLMIYQIRLISEKKFKGSEKKPTPKQPKTPAM